jgi:hypothetical protein
MKGGETTFPFSDNKEYLITFKDPNKDPINGVYNETDGPFLVFSFYDERNQLAEDRVRADAQGRPDDEEVKKVEEINIIRNKTYTLKFKGNKPDRISKYIGRFDPQNNYYFIDLKGTYKVSDNLSELEGIPVETKEPEYRIRFKKFVPTDVRVKIVEEQVEEGVPYVLYEDAESGDSYYLRKYDKMNRLNNDLEYPPINLGNGFYQIKEKPRQPIDYTVTLQRIIEGENDQRHFIFEDDSRDFSAVHSGFSQLEYEPVKVGGKRRTKRKRVLTKKRRRVFKLSRR